MLAITYNRMRVVTQTVVHSDWCGFCSRPTDHLGEHDDHIALGLAQEVEVNRRYFTNADGRTVHCEIELSTEPTELRHTPIGEWMMGELRIAWDAQWDVQMSGQVSLLKPVGRVITRVAQEVALV